MFGTTFAVEKYDERKHFFSFTSDVCDYDCDDVRRNYLTEACSYIEIEPDKFVEDEENPDDFITIASLDNDYDCYLSDCLEFYYQDMYSSLESIDATECIAKNLMKKHDPYSDEYVAVDDFKKFIEDATSRWYYDFSIKYIDGELILESHNTAYSIKILDSKGHNIYWQFMDNYLRDYSPAVLKRLYEHHSITPGLYF